jgi:hypothetical protein
MRIKPLKTLTTSSAITLALMVVLPRPAAAIDIGQLLNIGSDVSQLIQGGNFDLNSILGTLTDVNSIITGGSGGGTTRADGTTTDGTATDGTTTDGSGDGTQSSIGDSTGTGISQQDLQKAGTVISNVQGLYKAVSGHNIGGIFSGVKGLLGAFGIINPQAAANSVSSGGVQTNGSQGDGTGTQGLSQYNIPSTANAKSPEEVKHISGVGDTTERLASNDIAQMTLGEQGQQVLATRVAQDEAAMSSSEKASTSASNNVQSSVKAAQSSINGAKASAKSAQAAQKDPDSQAVLKKMSTQQALAAQQAAIQSGQLSLLTGSSSQVSNQLVALQKQGQIHTDQLQMMQLLGAGQLTSQVQIASIVDRQLQYNQSLDEQAVIAGAESATTNFIPGFVQPKSLQARQPATQPTQP